MLLPLPTVTVKLQSISNSNHIRLKLMLPAEEMCIGFALALGLGLASPLPVTQSPSSLPPVCGPAVGAWPDSHDWSISYTLVLLATRRSCLWGTCGSFPPRHPVALTEHAQLTTLPGLSLYSLDRQGKGYSESSCWTRVSSVCRNGAGLHPQHTHTMPSGVPG